MDRYRDVEMVPEPVITCPQCGATSGFEPANVEEGNAGCAMFMLGGLLPYLLYRSASQAPKVYCTRCHHVFTPKSSDSQYDLVVLVIFFLIFIIVCGMVVVTIRR